MPESITQCHDHAPLQWQGMLSLSPEHDLGSDKSDATRLKHGETIAEILAPIDADAIFLDWQIQSRVFKSPTGQSLGKQEADFLPFSSMLVKLADEMAEKIRPFVALHWRMEAVRHGGPPDFAGCARDALKVLSTLKDIKTVWFMTDFPMQGLDGGAHSDTFSTFLDNPANAKYRDAAVAGIDTLLAGFTHTNISRADLGHRPVARDIEATSLYVEAPELSFPDHVEPIRVDEYDAGLLGVISKLMAEKADVYLTGEPDECSRYSNYAAMIVRERAKADRPPASYFGKAAHRHYPV